MKTLFTLIALGTVATFTVDARPYVGQRYYDQNQYYGNGYYQPYDSGYYDQQGYYGDYQYQPYQQYQQYQQYPQYSQGSPNASYQARTDKDRDQRDQRVVSDDELTSKIRDTIGSGWFSKGYENVNYNVNNGYVTLRGTVQTEDDKAKVEDKVKKINGVRQVNNQIVVTGKGVNEETRSDNYDRSNQDDSYRSNRDNANTKYPQDFAASEQDRRINEKIRDKLGTGWFSKGNETLVIRTTNGFVIIQGTVDKMDDAQKINEKLKDIEGIRGVQNQVRVRNQ